MCCKQSFPHLFGGHLGACNWLESDSKTCKITTAIAMGPETGLPTDRAFRAHRHCTSRVVTQAATSALIRWMEEAGMALCANINQYETGISVFIPVMVNLLEISPQTAIQNSLIYLKLTTIQLNLNIGCSAWWGHRSRFRREMTLCAGCALCARGSLPWLHVASKIVNCVLLNKMESIVIMTFMYAGSEINCL